MWLKHFLMDAAGDGSSGGQSGAGGAGAGGAAGSGASGGDGAGGAGAGGAGTGGNEFGWLGQGVTADDQVFVKNKGWTEPKHVYESYRALEKLLGADKANRAVVLPKPDASPEERSAFFAKLGRPDTADGYGLDKLVPKDANPEFAKSMAEAFHAAGMNPDQAKAVVEKFNAFTAAQTEAAQAELAANGEAGMTALKKEWGAAYDQNVGIAKQAAKAFGFDEATIDAIQAAKGYDGVMKLLHTLGTKIGEADFVAGQGNSGGMMTPDQAQAQIRALRGDKEFVKKYVAGDLAARQEMERLHKMAYPGEITI